MKKSLFLNLKIPHKIWLEPIVHKKNPDRKEQFGLELEMYGFDSATLAPLGTEQSSITPQNVLQSITKHSKQSTILKDIGTNEIIGVKLKTGGNFSLEPGGQIEYSSHPCTSLIALTENVKNGLQLLQDATQKKVLFLSHGTNPMTKPSHPLVVSKKRYQAMTRYFQSAPKHIRGIDMMRHTATVQPNLDISKYKDWQTGIHLILQLIPITNSMFANSRYFQGNKSNFESERQNIWEHMDPSRSGYPIDLFSTNDIKRPGLAYVQWAKKACVIFIESLSIDEQPLYGEITFEQWTKNGYRGIWPTLNDWKIHLNTLFPHLRARNFLEIRNIDAQPFEHSFVPMAFYAALLKTQSTQQKTWELLTQYHFNTPQIHKENLDFSEIFEPLLNLASEFLEMQNEWIGVNVLQAYKKYLTEEKIYGITENALEFVQKHSTFFPAIEFIKHF